MSGSDKAAANHERKQDITERARRTMKRLERAQEECNFSSGSTALQVSRVKKAAVCAP